MNVRVAGPTFALIGVAGYIASRHLEVIREVGGTLIACHDITDSVGILDSYFPDARFFTDSAQFEDFLTRPGSRPDYFVVCTPNDLHIEHAALGLRVGSDVILEKPPALSSRELGALASLQDASGRAIHPVLQLRYHDGLRRFRKMMEWRNPERPVEVTVRYVTRRGQWFAISWKGDPARSGTIIFNIGIHLLDGLLWAIGAAPEVIRAYADPAGDHAEGRLQFGAVTADWILSTRETDLPSGTHAGAARYIAVDGDIICDFSDYSRLHAIVYREIMAGRGHRIEDAAGAVGLAERVREIAAPTVRTGMPASQ